MKECERLCVNVEAFAYKTRIYMLQYALQNAVIC